MMKKIALFACTACAIVIASDYYVLRGEAVHKHAILTKNSHPEIMSMTTTSMTSVVDTFIAGQNQNRGLAGEEVALDYNALTGTVPTGGNAVTGISGIAASASPISLAGAGTVIFNGAVGSATSTSGADNYGFSVDASGKVTVQDANTGNSQAITGANYLIFDNAATASTGAFQSVYFIENSTGAQDAALYAAALGRQPDLAGMEYYVNRLTSGEQTLFQQAASFLASPEFSSKFNAAALSQDNGGANDQAFIGQLYQNMLHRTESASELAWYINEIKTTFAGMQNYKAILLADFATSPENMGLLSSWLINTSNGAVNFGAMSPQAATNILTSEIASGTIDASSFATLPANSTAGAGTITDAVNVSGVTVYGANPTLNGGAVNGNMISLSTGAPANLTVDLSAQYNTVMMDAINVTVNGVSAGGSKIFTGSNGFAASLNAGGTVNLIGNGNVILTGNYGAGGITTPTIINGWNSTDIITEAGQSDASGVLTSNGHGVIYSGSATSKISGSALAASAYQGQGFIQNIFAINVGPIANDSTATMVTAANAAYTVADASAEHAFFFGEDPQGNTMVFFWRGDTGHTGTVQASDISGMVEVVGVHASSLAAGNFHI